MVIMKHHAKSKETHIHSVLSHSTKQLNNVLGVKLPEDRYIFFTSLPLMPNRKQTYKSEEKECIK